MATWVIQSNMIDRNDVSILVDIFQQEGIDFCRAEVFPFVDEITFLDKEPTNKNVIPYGSYKLTRLGLDKNWKGQFYNPETFRVDTWNKSRNDMLNHDAMIFPIGCISRIFKSMPPEEMWFIRPVEDLKHFNGVVTSAQEIVRFATSRDSESFSFSDDTLAAVSIPTKIDMEWRWFVVDGKVIDGSVYRMRGQRLTQNERTPSVIEEAQALADKWLPDKTCVMDIALTSNGPQVVEFNCINSAGFYNNNIRAIVKAMTRYVDEN